MSGRRSRSKGVRTERSIVNALQAHGLVAVRVPLSGAVGGRFAGDIVLPLLGRELCVEVKARRRQITPAEVACIILAGKQAGAPSVVGGVA